MRSFRGRVVLRLQLWGFFVRSQRDVGLGCVEPRLSEARARYGEPWREPRQNSGAQRAPRAQPAPPAATSGPGCKLQWATARSLARGNSFMGRCRSRESRLSPPLPRRDGRIVVAQRTRFPPSRPTPPPPPRPSRLPSRERSGHAGGWVAWVWVGGRLGGVAPEPEQGKSAHARLSRIVLWAGAGVR